MGNGRRELYIKWIQKSQRGLETIQKKILGQYLHAAAAVDPVKRDSVLKHYLAPVKAPRAIYLVKAARWNPLAQLELLVASVNAPSFSRPQAKQQQT